MNKIKKRNKIFISLVLFVTILLIITFTLVKCSTNVTIENYNFPRDYHAINNNLKVDEYWLFEEGMTFDVDHMLKTKSPDKNPAYYGKLKIKVLLENGKFAGFITYHKTGYHTGRIQFLSVSKNFRGKHYGKKLISYAVKDLFNQGCTQISLITRTNNVPAQKIYLGLGFKETGKDATFVSFTKYKN